MTTFRAPLQGLRLVHSLYNPDHLSGGFDVAADAFGFPFGAALTRAGADSVSVSDSVARAIGKSLFDSVTVGGDTVTRALQLGRIVAETPITVSDSVRFFTTEAPRLERAPLQGVRLQRSLLLATGDGLKTVNDTFWSALPPRPTLPVSASDSVTVGGDTAVHGPIGRSLVGTDTVGVAPDTVSRAVGHPRTANDVVNVSDAAVTGHVVFVTANDIVLVVDAATRQVVFARSVFEAAISVSDFASVPGAAVGSAVLVLPIYRRMGVGA